MSLLDAHLSASDEEEMGREPIELVVTQAPSSPSNSWSSTETALLPQESPIGDGCDARRPKRCKISREQLAVLISSFDEEPLPNFDQRQALAKLLGMTPRSVQIWFQNRRQRLKPMQPKTSGLGQPIGGGHCLTTPPTRGSGGSSLCNGGNQAGLQNLGMAGLAAATGMALGNSAAAGGFESLVLGHAMNQLHHNAALAGHSGGAAKYGALPSYDVMEPFAATKALLGAGYQPGAGPLASLSPRSQPAAAPLGAALAGALPALSSLPSCAHADAMASAAASGRGSCPSPAQLGADGAPAAKTEKDKADGLLLLLACADGNSSGDGS